MSTATTTRQNYLSEQEEKLSEIDRQIQNFQQQRDDIFDRLYSINCSLYTLRLQRKEIKQDKEKIEKIMQEKGEL